MRHAEHEVESTSSEHQRAAAKVEEQKMKLQAIRVAAPHQARRAGAAYRRHPHPAGIRAPRPGHSQRYDQHHQPYDNAGVVPAPTRELSPPLRALRRLPTPTRATCGL